jgi:hypothetical protein
LAFTWLLLGVHGIHLAITALLLLCRLVLLLLLLQHFFSNFEFSECVVFELFSSKASQFAFST